MSQFFASGGLELGGQKIYREQHVGKRVWGKQDWVGGPSGQDSPKGQLWKQTAHEESHSG